MLGWERRGSSGSDGHRLEVGESTFLSRARNSHRARCAISASRSARVCLGRSTRVRVRVCRSAVGASSAARDLYGRARMRGGTFSAREAIGWWRAMCCPLDGPLGPWRAIGLRFCC